MAVEFIPENEMGVVVRFAMDCQEHGWSIGSIGTRFPDAVVCHEGESFRAEFEYRASHFRDHRHDPRECDLIICWLNDWPDCLLPILSLSDWPDFKMRRASDFEKEMMHLRLENSRLKNELRAANIANNPVPIPKRSAKKNAKNVQPSLETGWRIEIIQHGRYWQWRRGSRKNRVSIYGGPISTLPPEWTQKKD